MTRNLVADVLLGVAVGDALGVPHEFKGRSVFVNKPVTFMEGYGTYHVPVGTWSDDTSLTLCLAQSLVKGYDLEDIAANFVKWVKDGLWTATGVLFDIGITTKNSIRQLERGINPLHSGDFDEYANGNGSLMRILPLIFYLKDKPINERYELVKQVSAITHAHIRSVIACFYYTEFALQLIQGVSPMEAYNNNKTKITHFLTLQDINPKEIDTFKRLLQEDIYFTQDNFIMSSGYVIHTLEASIWSVLTTSSYKEAVLKAVNLGEDTDTTGAVTGGLAGLIYGTSDIPYEWLSVLARKDDISKLADELSARCFLPV